MIRFVAMGSLIIVLLPHCVLAVPFPLQQALGFVKLIGRREPVEIIGIKH